MTLTSSIIVSTQASPCYVSVTDGGHNLVHVAGGGSVGSCPTGGTNISGQDPLLGALQVNAPGTTATMALGAGSPAIDAVAAGCPPPSTDQRGVTRPQGARCDIGAYEVQVASAITVQPTFTG